MRLDHTNQYFITWSGRGLGSAAGAPIIDASRTNSRGTMSSPQISHVTDATFDPEVLKSETPVLVDYWAEWCGPCKTIAPILDDLAKEYGGRLKIAKINV